MIYDYSDFERVEDMAELKELEKICEGIDYSHLPEWQHTIHVPIIRGKIAEFGTYEVSMNHVEAVRYRMREVIGNFTKEDLELRLEYLEHNLETFQAGEATMTDDGRDMSKVSVGLKRYLKSEIVQKALDKTRAELAKLE